MVFPNPSHESINIFLDLSSPQNVEIKIYNILGEFIATVFNGRLEPGVQLVPWYSNYTASGIYFIKIQSIQINHVVRCVFVK
ncbi:T9SS type A sorting domain-containing protein [candidate division KSB1 bacterium]|nr:T9SS type A sorting domain-containing protein [candidate division KSB1 bacterium]